MLGVPEVLEVLKVLVLEVLKVLVLEVLKVLKVLVPEVPRGPFWVEVVYSHLSGGDPPGQAKE